jgi:hypothetical protein
LLNLFSPGDRGFESHPRRFLTGENRFFVYFAGWDRWLYAVLRDARRSMAKTSNGKDTPNLTSPLHPDNSRIISPLAIKKATAKASTGNHHN